jgi:hypothetical protein
VKNRKISSGADMDTSTLIRAPPQGGGIHGIVFVTDVAHAARGLMSDCPLSGTNPPNQDQRHAGHVGLKPKDGSGLRFPTQSSRSRRSTIDFTLAGHAQRGAKQAEEFMMHNLDRVNRKRMGAKVFLCPRKACAAGIEVHARSSGGAQ